MALPPSPAPQYPEERRLVTVMFADILGFTELSEQMDFEQISDLIKDIWQRVDLLLEQHGGYMDKHIGDAVMAIWGAPHAGEDDAERAVRAALALEAGLRTFAARSGWPAASTLQMRVGLNTGLVFAGYVGVRNEYTVMGDTVNVASRLQASAEPGTVVIGEATYQLVRGAFQAEALPPLSVKGKAEPVAAYVVRGPLPGRQRARTLGARGFETAMVARDEEMRRLKALFDDARTGQRPVLACVEGEAGIGKSRLMMEFSRELQAHETGLVVLSARCLHEFRHVPFYMWKSLWFDGLGLSDDDPPEATREKLVRSVQRWWGRQLGQASSLEAAHVIGSLVGLDWPDSPYLAALRDQPPEARLKRATQLTRELLRRMAANGPMVIMLDDLQWMDQAGGELLLSLLAPGEPLPLLIIGGIRAGWRRAQPHLAQAATVISLPPLPIEAQTVASAYPRLSALPPAVLLTLAERAGGNPYFLEEMVKTLFAGGQAVAASSLSAAELNSRLPDTLHAVLQARLDALSPAARAVALLASVVGRVFWVGAVEAAAQESASTGILRGEAPVAAPRIRHALAEIEQAELAFPRAGSVLAGEQEYIFKHSLLRDVAYRLLPHKHLPQYHLAVAHWLAVRTGPALAARVGAHLEAAGDYPAAAEHYVVAAQYALSHGADDGAAWLSSRAQAIKDKRAAAGTFHDPLGETGSISAA